MPLALAPGLLLLLLLASGARSRLRIVTDPSSRALLGSGALLKCRFNVGGPVDLRSLRVQWFLFEETIAQYDQGRGQSQPGASMSEQELERGDASLSLSRVTVSDEGPYQCVVGYGAEQLQGETTLRVLAAPRLSMPRKAGVLNAASAFPCHVWGFYPGDVTVTWLRDGRVLTDVTPSAPQRNPDGTFNLTLTYTFTPTASDSGSLFSCRVSHAALAQPLREEFALDVTGADHTSAAIGATLGILVAGGAAAALAIYCRRKRRKGRGAPFSVSELLGPAQYLLGQEVTLSCAMGGTFPEDTAVTWERIHGEDRTVIGTDGVSEAGEGPEVQPLLHPQPHGWRATQERSGTCLTASLSFTPTVQDDGARVRCSFHHEARGIREQRESGEIRPWARPQVPEIQVLPEWEPREEVPFAVQIQNFYPRGIHRIQWRCDGKAWEKCEPTDCSQNPDLTFSATSVWRIPSDQITRPEFTVTVSVQQSPREPPIEREIRAGDTGLLRPPEVSEISQPESVTAGEEITLSCRMAGHFPGVLSVTWLRRGRGARAADPLQGSAEYSIEPGAPRTQDGKSFEQETRLRFTPSVQRDQGAEYVCRVGHVILRTPVERRSGELQVTDQLPMPAPVCLVENSPAGELRVLQEALRVLAEISQPVAVVAIAGLSRTGKSYLLNRLAGKRTGFSLDATIQLHTKGIWMWCLPHPRRAGHTLVLLDTEGLGDVEKGDAKNDTWIFALAMLLSSTLVYNSRGTIDQQAMDQLHYVMELTEHIKVKAAGEGGRQDGEDSAEFVRFFPAFVWAVRDFTLQLELDGQKVTEDEYLENSLKLKTGSSQQTPLYNQPRQCIRKFFPARKCFVFVQPARSGDLRRLEELREDELEPEFREQVARFCRHVWETSQPKTIPGGHVVTGAMLGNLAVTYVDAIRSGTVPCVESAVLALAQIENSAAVGEAVAVYEKQLARRAALPTESLPELQELLDLHAQCEREALRAFMARSFKDDDRSFQGKLMGRLEEQKQELCRRNELASSDRCRAALLELWVKLDDGISQRVYSVPGGYQRFLDDRQQIVERYRQVPGKGVKAEEVLQMFLQSKEAVAQSILQTDEALTEKEKEAAAQRARDQAAEREKEVLKQKEAELQQKLEDQDRSYQENLRQLEEKLEGERKKLLEEQGKMVDQKLKEQAALLREGFQEEARRMQREIQRLQQQIEEIQKPSWIESGLKVLRDVALSVLPILISKFFACWS